MEGDNMKDAILTILAGLLLSVQAVVANAEYTETMKPDGLIKNLKTDFGLVDDNAQSDQSAILQEAIDDVSAKGGGRLILPKGTYRFARVYLKSNVHLLIEKDTVIKPYWPKGEKNRCLPLGRGGSVQQEGGKGEGKGLHRECQHSRSRWSIHRRLFRPRATGR